MVTPLVSLSKRQQLASKRLNCLPLSPGAVVLQLVAAGGPGGQAEDHAIEAICQRSEESVDAVVAVGLLKRLRWDRWTLQEIQRVLKPGGWLVMDCPRGIRLQPWIRKAICFGWGRLRRPASMALPPFARSAGEGAASYRGRAMYWRHHLRRLLDSMGYEIEEQEQPAPIPHRAADLVVCRKPAAPKWTLKRPPDEDCETLRRRFQIEHARGLSRLQQWLEDHPLAEAELIGASLAPRSWESQIHLAAPVLVLSPHPDDELIGCGGTLLKMRKAGAPVTIIQMTDGSASAALSTAPFSGLFSGPFAAGAARRRQVRVDEAKRVAQVMGARLETWKAPDGELMVNDENVWRLVDVLAEARPRVIFAPFLSDPHPDHQAAAKILAAALLRAPWDGPPGGVLVAGYEVWGLAPVNVVSDIDEFFEQRSRLLFQYRTAMKVVDYVRFCHTLHSWRCRELLDRPGFAEGFFVTTAPDYVRLFEKESAHALAPAAQRARPLAA